MLHTARINANANYNIFKSVLYFSSTVLIFIVSLVENRTKSKAKRSTPTRIAPQVFLASDLRTIIQQFLFEEETNKYEDAAHVWCVQICVYIYRHEH